jgi:hypothetical protein
LPNYNVQENVLKNTPQLKTEIKITINDNKNISISLDKSHK